MEVTAAPSSEDSRTRRRALPERHSIARLERPRLVLGVGADFLDGLDLRAFEFDHDLGAYLE